MNKNKFFFPLDKKRKTVYHKIMKKIVACFCLCVVLFSCGKKESGSLTVINNSDYAANVMIVPEFDLDGARVYNIIAKKTKTINYVGKIAYYISVPHNLAHYSTSNDLITISNADSTFFYKGTITNKLECDISVIDNKTYLIADESKTYIDELSITANSSKQLFFLSKATNYVPVIKASGIYEIITDKDGKLILKKNNQFVKFIEIYCDEKTVTPTATERQTVAYEIIIH